MNKYLLGLLIAGAIGSVAVQAQSSDALLNKLVQKGYLTKDEADDLKKETDAGFDKAYRARTGLPDPNFKDSTVLVMNHMAPAPLGVIVNRPTRIPVSQLFPDLEGLARLDARASRREGNLRQEI